ALACSWALLSSPVHTGSSSPRCAWALSFHRVLRLLDLGCGGATLAYASLEAGHAGTSRIRRPDRCFGFCFLTSLTTLGPAVADRAWDEISPWNPPRQPGRSSFSCRGRRHHLSRRAPAFVGGRRP